MICVPLSSFTGLVLVAEPLDDDETEEKERLIEEGFEDWSRRDFQQFVRGLESYGWYVWRVFRRKTGHHRGPTFFRTEDYALLASEIQDKTEEDVRRYYPVFKAKWQTLAGRVRLI